MHENRVGNNQCYQGLDNGENAAAREDQMRTEAFLDRFKATSDSHQDPCFIRANCHEISASKHHHDCQDDDGEQAAKYCPFNCIAFH